MLLIVLLLVFFLPCLAFPGAFMQLNSDKHLAIFLVLLIVLLLVLFCAPDCAVAGAFFVLLIVLLLVLFLCS